MFFSYAHHPYEDYEVDETAIPLEPIYGRSHKNL
jgi:tRNA nucleotidyltransferase (CCA-adding enzyme)